MDGQIDKLKRPTDKMTKLTVTSHTSANMPKTTGIWFSKVPDTSLALSFGTLSSGRTLTSTRATGYSLTICWHQTRYLTTPMESFTKPSTSIYVSSSRNKGATDKPGLDHHPHNSATDRILHNPQNS
jgi:hypothetical protein